MQTNGETNNRKVLVDENNVNESLNPDSISEVKTTKRIKFSEATDEEIINAIKGIEETLGIKIKIDDIKGLNQNTSVQDKFIDPTRDSILNKNISQKNEPFKKIKRRVKNPFKYLGFFLTTLFGIGFFWVVIIMPIALCLSILSQHGIIPKYMYDKGVDYVGWVVFCFCFIYGMKFNYDLVKKK